MDRELETIFASKGLRLTAPRRIIFDAMRAYEEPISATTLAAKCKDIDKVSVYRTLELFSQLGIVQPVPIGWKQCYELSGPFKTHHHHFNCTGCGKVIDLHSSPFERSVALLAKENGFLPLEHTFEIRGLCADCLKR